MRQTQAEKERGEWPAIRQNTKAMAGNYEALLALQNNDSWSKAKGKHGSTYRKHMLAAVRLWNEAISEGFVCC